MTAALHPYVIVVAVAALASFGLFVRGRESSRQEAKEAVAFRRKRGVAIRFDPARFNSLAVDMGKVAVVISAVFAAIVMAVVRYIMGVVGWPLAACLGGAVGFTITPAYSRRIAAAYLLAQAATDGVDLVPINRSYE